MWRRWVNIDFDNIVRRSSPGVLALVLETYINSGRQTVSRLTAYGVTVSSRYDRTKVGKSDQAFFYVYLIEQVVMVSNKSAVYSVIGQGVSQDEILPAYYSIP